MRNQVRKIVTVFFFLYPLCTYSQEVIRVNKEDVIVEAKSQLAVMSSESGKLNEFCKENNIQGEFVIDITLQGKGKVLTIFMVSSNVEDVKYQNLLKDALAQVQFENIKIPKNERVKFRQTLTF